MGFFAWAEIKKKTYAQPGSTPQHACTTKGSTTVPCTLGILPPMKQHHPVFHIKQQGQHLAIPVLFEGAMNRSSDGFSFSTREDHPWSLDFDGAKDSPSHQDVQDVGRPEVSEPSAPSILPLQFGKTLQGGQKTSTSTCFAVVLLNKNWAFWKNRCLCFQLSGLLKWNCIQLSSAWGLKWFSGRRIESSKRWFCTDWTMNVGEGFVWSLEYAAAIRKSCHSHVFATGGFVCPFEGAVIYSLRVEFTRIKKPSRLVFSRKGMTFFSRRNHGGILGTRKDEKNCLILCQKTSETRMDYALTVNVYSWPLILKILGKCPDIAGYWRLNKR